MCPLCEHQQPRIVWEYQGRQYLTCSSCQLAFISPLQRGSQADVGAASSSVTDPSYLEKMKQQSLQREQQAYPLATKRLAAYASLLGHPPQSILEIGAGDGAFSPAYAKLGVDYLGADVSSYIVKEAQMLGRNVIYGSAEAVAALNREFEVIFFSQVLEHILEPQQFLRLIHSLLLPGGLVHIEVPNHDGLFARLRRLSPRGNEYGFLQPPHHQIAYTRHALNFLLQRTGFAPIWVKQKSDFDVVWGELHTEQMGIKQVVLHATTWLGMGSLLVGVARKQAVSESNLSATLQQEKWLS